MDPLPKRTKLTLAAKAQLPGSVTVNAKLLVPLESRIDELSRGIKIVTFIGAGKSYDFFCA